MYSWKPQEVFQLLGIPVPNRNEVYVPCPSCGSKRFGFNMLKGIGKCWSCNFSADSASYYAVTTGQSINNARLDIEKRLGIIDSNGKKNDNLPQRIVYKTPEVKESQRASDDILDDTYRAFLAELTLSEKNKLHLLSRGMTEKEINARMYRTMPHMDEIDFFALCRRLQTNGHSLNGVPGFFKTKRDDYTFTQTTKGIIMPLINYKNQITGLQIRKDDDLRVFIEEIGKMEEKCAWLSSKNKKGGCNATAGVHYACDFIYDTSKNQYKPVFEDGFMLTEGIMKADIAHQAQPNIPIISVPGVNATTTLKAELLRLKSWGIKVILVCFDMDYQTNPHVQTALEKVKALIEECGLIYKPGRWENYVTVNGKEYNLNGIDDYLAFAKYGIVPHVKIK